MGSCAKRPVIIISNRQVTAYASISVAARSEGISKQRLIRGLQTDDGLIPGTRGSLFIDDALPEHLGKKVEKEERYLLIRKGTGRCQST